MNGIELRTYKNARKLVGSYPKIALTVDCVIFGFDDNELKVLMIRSDLENYKGKWSLLGDMVKENEDIDVAAYRVLKTRTGLDNVYLEQVHTFGSLNRHPGGRVVTVAYYSLINIKHYQLEITDNELHWHSISNIKNMAFDHKHILDYCYNRLQKRVQEHPLGLNLLPDKFSLRELQNLYEAILNIPLDRRNFRKKFFSMGYLIDTGEYEDDVPHRPGKLYRFDYKKHNSSKKKLLGIDF